MSLSPITCVDDAIKAGLDLATLVVSQPQSWRKSPEEVADWACRELFPRISHEHPEAKILAELVSAVFCARLAELERS